MVHLIQPSVNHTKAAVTTCHPTPTIIQSARVTLHRPPLCVFWVALLRPPLCVSSRPSLVSAPFISAIIYSFIHPSILVPSHFLSVQLAWSKQAFPFSIQSLLSSAVAEGGKRGMRWPRRWRSREGGIVEREAPWRQSSSGGRPPRQPELLCLHWTTGPGLCEKQRFQVKRFGLFRSLQLMTMNAKKLLA